MSNPLQSGIKQPVIQHLGLHKQHLLYLLVQWCVSGERMKYRSNQTCRCIWIAHCSLHVTNFPLAECELKDS